MGNSLHASGSMYASRKAREFTLLELIVVLMTIGMPVGYVGPKYFAQIGKSEAAAERAQINALGKALDRLQLDSGHGSNTEAAGCPRPTSVQRGQLGGPLAEQSPTARPMGQALRLHDAGRA